MLFLPNWYKFDKTQKTEPVRRPFLSAFQAIIFVGMYYNTEFGDKDDSFRIIYS